MRNVCMGLTAIVVGVSVMSAAGQGRSFSGTWVVDQERTMVAMRTSLQNAVAGVAVARGVGGGGVSSGSGGATMVARGGAASAGGGGRGGGVMSSGGGGGDAVASAGGGGRGGGGVIASVAGAPANAETVITLDGTAFSIEVGGVHTSYPLNGSDVVVQMRGAEGRAHASWAGDRLAIETTMDTANGPVVTRTSWFMEGDALVRETQSKTYYKRK